MQDQRPGFVDHLGAAGEPEQFDRTAAGVRVTDPARDLDERAEFTVDDRAGQQGGVGREPGQRFGVGFGGVEARLCDEPGQDRVLAEQPDEPARSCL